MKTIKRRFNEKNLLRQTELFQKHLLMTYGLQKGTINNMKKLIKIVLQNFHTLYLNDKMIESLIIKLRDDKYSFTHISNISLAIERYMKFINNPIKIARMRKPKHTAKDPLSEAEIAIVINATNNIREKAMVTLLAYSGIRCGELCNLKVKDVDIGNNILYVIQGKGSKDRTIPISSLCSQILMQYLTQFARNKDSYLFTTIRHNLRFSEWALRRRIKKIVSRTNIDKNIHPHLFRHSLATNMLLRGANLMTIKQQLGHSNINTTMLYLTPKTTRLFAEYQNFVPSYI